MDKVTGEMIAKIAGGAVVIILLYLLVIKPIFRRVGIIETKEDRERDQKAKDFATKPDSPFNPTYWQSVKNAPLLQRAITEQLANQVNEAIGFFSDDENLVYGAFRQLKHKTQVSWLADVFFQLHKVDMYQLLNRNLGDAEMDVIHGIVDELQ